MRSKEGIFEIVGQKCSLWCNNISFPYLWNIPKSKREKKGSKEFSKFPRFSRFFSSEREREPKIQYLRHYTLFENTFKNPCHLEISKISCRDSNVFPRSLREDRSTKANEGENAECIDTAFQIFCIMAPSRPWYRASWPALYRLLRFFSSWYCVSRPGGLLASTPLRYRVPAAIFYPSTSRTLLLLISSFLV